MLVVGVVVGIVVVVVVAALVARRRTHDDEHSVKGYHRQLHTLEAMGGHPSAGTPGNGTAAGDPSPYPDSALRLSGTRTVRLTDAVGPTVPPPLPPPPAAALGQPVRFDDDVPAAPSPGPGWMDDRTISAMNRRPRRLLAPTISVVAVAALIAVLLVTGSHPPARDHHRSPGSAVRRTTATRKGATPGKHDRSSVTTLPRVVVSSPMAVTANGATYYLADSAYSLQLSATSACWVDATATATGTGLFTGVLQPGQAHLLAATGSVTVVVGAPAAFVATVDGSTIALPAGYRTPFTVHLVPFPSPTTAAP